MGVLFLIKSFFYVHMACMAAGQSIFIHWDRISDGVRFPRIDGIDPFPENLASNLDSPKLLGVPASESSVTKIADEKFPSTIAYSGFVNMSHPALNDLSVREIRSILQREKIKCRACSERSDFIDAMRGHLASLSIKSLKNFIVVRGLSCRECKSKDELILNALHGAHLPHLNVTVPLFILEDCWLYPRASLRMMVLEPQIQFMLDWIMQRGGRFGLLPTSQHGIIARIQEMTKEQNGKTTLRIVGEHRFRIHGPEAKWEMENSHGFTMANATLFVDDPVTATKVAELKQPEKMARREFFRHDSDAKAARRELTLIGNPPPENLGSEVFSHWLAMASEAGSNKKEMFLTTSTHRRLKLGFESLVQDLKGGGQGQPHTPPVQQPTNPAAQPEAKQSKPASKPLEPRAGAAAGDGGKGPSARKAGPTEQDSDGAQCKVKPARAAKGADASKKSADGAGDPARRSAAEGARGKAGGAGSGKASARKESSASARPPPADAGGGRQPGSDARKAGGGRRPASGAAPERDEPDRGRARQRPASKP
jgi:Lon protease-like protein